MDFPVLYSPAGGETKLLRALTAVKLTCVI